MLDWRACKWHSLMQARMRESAYNGHYIDSLVKTFDLYFEAGGFQRTAV